MADAIIQCSWLISPDFFKYNWFEKFFSTLNSFEEKICLRFLDATWVGLQDSCLSTVLAFLGSDKSAAISNIKLIAQENGEGGGHKLSQEDLEKLKLGLNKHHKLCEDYQAEQLRQESLAKIEADRKAAEEAST